jgi:YVTN family beta-propeller protein
MIPFYRKKIASIVLSAVMVTASLLFTSSSSAAPSAAGANTAPQTEWAYVTNSSSKSVTIIDTKTKKEVATIPVGESPDAIAVTSDGKKAYVLGGSLESFISVIDTQSKKVTATIPIDIRITYALTITPDEKYVYVTGHGTLSIIDIEKEEVVKKLYMGDYNYVVTMNPNGKQAYVSSQGNISVIDIATQKVLRTISMGYDGLPKDIDFMLDGKRAYIAIGQSILVIDTEKEEVINTITVKENFFNPYEVVISPNGNRIYLAGSSSGTTPDQILVIDTKTHSITKAIYAKSAPLGMAITSDGKELYITHCDHDDVSVLDTQTYKVRHSISVGRYPRQIIIAPSPE